MVVRVLLCNTGRSKRIRPRVKSAAMGIRTPVFGVKGRNDWPDYTIAAIALLC
jgi:hypothetical protein